MGINCDGKKKIKKFEKKSCFFDSSLLEYHSARWKNLKPRQEMPGGGVWFAEY